MTEKRNGNRPTGTGRNPKFDLQASRPVFYDFGWKELVNIARQLEPNLPDGFFPPLHQFHKQENVKAFVTPPGLAEKVCGISRSLVIYGYTDQAGIQVIYFQYQDESKKAAPTDEAYRHESWRRMTGWN